MTGLVLTEFKLDRGHRPVKEYVSEGDEKHEQGAGLSLVAEHMISMR